MIVKFNANEHENGNDIDYETILNNGDDSNMITAIAIIGIAVPNVDNK